MNETEVIIVCENNSGGYYNLKKKFNNYESNA